MSESDFAGNELVRDAVLRNLEIIGEVAKFIPEDVRGRAVDLDWRRVVGFRNVVAHAYFGIDPAILWDIVSSKIGELLAAMNMADRKPE